MGFFIYDISFLILFMLFVAIFLYKKRKNLKREGLAFLYRTKLGLKFIDYANKKLKKILPILSWLSIICGYVLMSLVLYFIFRLVYLTAKFPELFKIIKVPPLIPLIPYLPKIFKIDILPPFYFTYWIIAIAVIAIFHEFNHGIFAKFNKLKIKSTGFGFLGPFLLAFVEIDEKTMAKRKKLPQISILSAGSFANVILAVIFLLLMWIFFSLTFMEGGAFFDSYTLSQINISQIKSIENISVVPTNENMLAVLQENNFSQDLIIINTRNKKFLFEPELLKQQLETETDKLILYDDAPAVNARLKGIIIEIDGAEIKNNDQLAEKILEYKPGDKVNIKTRLDGEIPDYNITLIEHPQNKSKAFIGIGVLRARKSGFFSKLYGLLAFFQDSSTHYIPKINKNLAIFIYNLLWWLVIINISVALINMLPFAIFDGGRVFYLTVLALVKKENRAKKIFSVVNYLIVLMFLVLMLIWFFAVIR